MIAEQPSLNAPVQSSLISYCSLDAPTVFFKWLQEHTTPYSVVTFFLGAFYFSIIKGTIKVSGEFRSHTLRPCSKEIAERARL
jgi:hypothetical protein